MSDEPNWLEFFADRERLHANFYLDFAQQHARRDPIAYDHLEAESGNLLKIATWLAERNEAEGILQLATALWQESDFLRSRGFMQRGLPLLEQALQAAHQIGDRRAEFNCLEALAHIHFEANNIAFAQPLSEQALVLAQDIDEPLLKAQAYLRMGRLLLDMGQWERSAVYLKQARQEYRQIQDHAGEIKTLTALGDLLSLQGNFVEAEAYLAEGLPLAQAAQDPHSEVTLRYCLGYVGTSAKVWLKAIPHYEAATDMARQLGNRFIEIRGLTSLGEAWLGLGDTQQAVTLLEEAQARQETSDDALTKMFTHFNLAKAYHACDEPDKSLVQLNQIYSYLLEMRQLPVLAAKAAEAAWLIADNYLKQGRTDLAKTALYDVFELVPAHKADIRQAAEATLAVIAPGEHRTKIEH